MKTERKPKLNNTEVEFNEEYAMLSRMAPLLQEQFVNVQNGLDFDAEKLEKTFGTPPKGWPHVVTYFAQKLRNLRFDLKTDWTRLVEKLKYLANHQLLLNSNEAFTDKEMFSTDFPNDWKVDSV